MNNLNKAPEVIVTSESLKVIQSPIKLGLRDDQGFDDQNVRINTLEGLTPNKH